MMFLISIVHASTVLAAIGPSIEEAGGKHPVWSLFIIGIIIIIGGILGYLGLKKHLIQPLFKHKASTRKQHS